MPHDEVFDQLAGRDRELLRSGQSEPPHSNGDLRGDPARIDHVYDGLVLEGLRGVGQLLACAYLQPYTAQHAVLVPALSLTVQHAALLLSTQLNQCIMTSNVMDAFAWL